MTASIADTSDSSRRFILPEDAPYLRNLAALWATDPRLAAAIEGPHPRESYTTEPSKSGALTIAIESNGRKIQLHSRHQPIDEAKRLIDPIDFDAKLAFYVHGFGLGYHVQQIFDRAGDESIILVFEPDLLILRTAFEQLEFTKLIESRRVHFVYAPDKADLFNRLIPHSATLSLGPQRVEHGPSLQLQPEFHRQMQTWLDEFAAYCRTSMNTLVLNGRRTAENIARNIGWYVATPCMSRLHDAYKSKPAIIVSAGPSLRKNKHLLKDADGKACIIAVQTTFQPLLELGIEPQFVTSLDYHDICTRFFEKLPRTLRTELIAEPKATSKIFNLNPGPLSILGNEFAENLIREMRVNKTRLRSGATVAHLAYYLAEHLGCDPIIFVGQDLGFSDGLCYAPGTSYDDVWRPELGRFCTVEMKQWDQIVRDRAILRRIPDHEGRPMYTEERLFTYLQQFEKDFATTRTTIIDATEGGALKRGSTSMKLADALEQFCREPIRANADARVEGSAPAEPAGREASPPSGPDAYHPGLNWDRLPQCLASLQERRKESAEIEQISRDTLPLLEEVRDHLDDQRRVNKAIARIDVLRARMNDLGPCYDLITQLTQKTELQRFTADRKISASKIDGVERQRWQVSRDIDNVRGVVEAAQQFQVLMDETIEIVTRAIDATTMEVAA